MSRFVVKSFSWLRVERSVVYKVTDEQRHGGGEIEVCQVRWLLPCSSLRRMRTEADEADFSRALEAQAMTR